MGDCLPGASQVTRALVKARKASCYQGTRGIQIHLHKSHAFPCFLDIIKSNILENIMLPMLSFL